MEKLACDLVMPAQDEGFRESCEKEKEGIVNFVTQGTKGSQSEELYILDVLGTDHVKRANTKYRRPGTHEGVRNAHPSQASACYIGSRL
jgi:hypothetical protein